MPATHQQVLCDPDPNDLGSSGKVRITNWATMHNVPSRRVGKGRNAYKIKQLQGVTIDQGQTETDDRRQHSACKRSYATLLCLCVPDMMKVVLVGEEGVLVVRE